jgi:hypothetical protein
MFWNFYYKIFNQSERLNSRSQLLFLRKHLAKLKLVLFQVKPYEKMMGKYKQYSLIVVPGTFYQKSIKIMIVIDGKESQRSV